MKIQMHRFFFEFPAVKEPGWKHLVERWYQLDAASYGLVEAYWNLKDQLGDQPQFLVLASPGASNETDFDFTQGKAASPQRFVHTLPNVRCSPLCQVMGWNGPMLCVSSGMRTIISGVQEGLRLVKGGQGPVWVMSNVLGEASRGVYLFCLSDEPGDSTTSDANDRAFLDRMERICF